MSDPESLEEKIVNLEERINEIRSIIAMNRLEVNELKVVLDKMKRIPVAAIPFELGEKIKRLEGEVASLRTESIERIIDEKIKKAGEEMERIKASKGADLRPLIEEIAFLKSEVDSKFENLEKRFKALKDTEKVYKTIKPLIEKPENIERIGRLSELMSKNQFDVLEKKVSEVYDTIVTATRPLNEKIEALERKYRDLEMKQPEGVNVIERLDEISKEILRIVEKVENIEERIRLLESDMKKVEVKPSERVSFEEGPKEAKTFSFVEKSLERPKAKPIIIE